jgi:alkyl hydroperoxide reductase subunit AhpC
VTPPFPPGRKVIRAASWLFGAHSASIQRFTGGCNIEAHTFAENKEKFDAAGASIIGVSADSVTRLNTFSADPQYCAGKIPVASDSDGAIAKSFELKTSPGKPGLRIRAAWRSITTSPSGPRSS